MKENKKLDESDISEKNIEEKKSSNLLEKGRLLNGKPFFYSVFKNKNNVTLSLGMPVRQGTTFGNFRIFKREDLLALIEGLETILNKHYSGE